MKSIDHLFFVLFCVAFVIVAVYSPDISGYEFFLHNFLGNKIWQLVLIGVVIFIFGKRIIDSMEEGKN